MRDFGIKIALLALAVLAVASALPLHAQPFKISPTDAPPGKGFAPTGSTILLSQAPNQVNGIFSDVTCGLCAGSQVLAENFVLATNETVTNITLWGGYFPTDTPNATDTFTVIFHSDAAGLPGANVAPPEANVPVSRAMTGVILFGVNEWQFDLTLASPVTLAPGTYFVEIYNDTAGNPSGDDYFWETGNLDPATGIAGQAFSFSAPGAGWFYDPTTDMAVVVEAGAVPTMGPSAFTALALVLLVAAGFALARRRREV